MDGGAEKRTADGGDAMAGPVIKTPAEIAAMREAGRVVARVLRRLEDMIAPGITTAALDRAAREVISDAGGTPSFAGYPSAIAGVPPFPAAICASVNEEVVHGIPGERELREGDIISVDVGVILNGFHGDAARTYAVGEVSRKARRLLQVTEECLRKAIAALRAGVMVSRISAAIEGHARQHGFSVVRKFVGHGIGRNMHEPPQVPNYVSRFFADARIALPAGATLAIEPMVNIGGHDVMILDNGWTVVTKDRSLSAHFEHTVAITAEGPAVLTEIA